MITAVSHLALSAENPKQAAADYAVILDRQPSVYATEDGKPFYRFQLANIALEISQGTDGKTGLTDLGFEATDIEATVRKLGRRGLGMGAVVQQTYKGQGTGDLTRRAASIDIGSTHGVPLSIVETDPSRDAQAMASVSGLDHVVIRCPNPERAVALYGGRLGLDFALDRTNADWGSRLLFFVCGGVRVEIGHALAKGVSDLPDSLWGVAWRVTDAADAQARLRAAGLDTSEAKKGRRPGSSVLTVRSGTCNVPTIMLSAVPQDAAA
jgi:catechol 2,3-dioxygenase-like lactoylglutathione lyase family enzyme